MEARKKRNIKSGLQYDHLFPKANVDTNTVMKNAGVGDTVAFIPKVVNKTLDHTKGIAAILKGNNDYETCRNIWHFVYNHIAYRKDRDGYEQIRSPARSWHDRKAGVDCDCYSTFISSILTNLGIGHKLRITKYHRDYFQHIYPIAELQNKRQVVIDCVTDKFDYEVPFSEKKDYPMDLQYLNGLDGLGYSDGYMDGTGGMEELGKLFKKKAKNKGGSSGGGKKKKKGGGIFKKIGNAVKKAGQGVKKAVKKVNLKKVLNVVNKFNPATVALRNGVLASMKLNVGNVAKRLRWSYITPEQARAKKMDMGKWQKLVDARIKLEKIFYGAGGKPENMKKAILNGKGNKNHEVHGLDGFGALYDHKTRRFHHPMSANNRMHRIHPMHPHHPVNSLNKHMPLRAVIGDEMFHSENPVGTLGELGEPVSMAMIAAASGVIAAIASTLKKIGDIFGGKGKGSEDFDENANKEAEKEIPEGGKSEEDAKATESITDGSSGGSTSSGGGDESSGGGGSAGKSTPSKSSNSSDDDNSGGGSSGGSSGSSGGSISSGSGGSSSGGGSSGGGGGSSSGGGGGSTEVATTGGGGGDDGGGGEEAPTKALAKKSSADGGGGGADEPKAGGSFFENNKKWIMPVGIGIGVISVGAIIAKAMKPHPPAPAPQHKAMHGLPRKKNHKRTKPKATQTKGKAKGRTVKHGKMEAVMFKS